MIRIAADVRDPGHDGEYRAGDVDEMTMATLTVMAEVRRRLAAAFPWNPDVADRIGGVIDGYAREIRDEHTGGGDEGGDDDR